MTPTTAATQTTADAYAPPTRAWSTPGSTALAFENQETGDGRIFGIMAESHLNPGRQDLVPGKDLVYGMSITDACIGWDDSRELLEELAAAVRERRLKAATDE